MVPGEPSDFLVCGSVLAACADTASAPKWVLCEAGTALGSSRDVSVVATAVREDDGRAASRRLRALRQPLESGLAATTSCHHREELVKSFSQDTWVFFLLFKVFMKYGCKEEVSTEECKPSWKNNSKQQGQLTSICPLLSCRGATAVCGPLLIERAVLLV